MKLRWVIIAFALVFLAILFWPKKQNDYSDLSFYRLPVPAQSNAFYFLRKITITNRTLPWDSLRTNWTVVEDLAPWKLQLQIFDEAILFPFFEIPLDTPPQKLGEFLDDCRHLTWVNLLRAKSYFIQSNDVAAVDYLVKNLDFADRLEVANGGFFGFDIAYGIRGATLELARMLSLRSTNQGSFTMLAERLSNPRGSDLLILAKETFYWCSNALNDLPRSYPYQNAPMPAGFRNPLLRSVLFDPDDTKDSLAERVRHIAKYSSTHFTNVPAQPAPPNSYMQIFSGNALGRILEREFIADTKYLIRFRYGQFVDFECTRLILLIRCFYLEHGTFPNSLNEVVNPVPIDPFDGRPMKYSKEKRVVYSVGRDLLDGGGEKRVDQVFSFAPEE